MLGGEAGAIWPVVQAGGGGASGGTNGAGSRSAARAAFSASLAAWASAPAGAVASVGGSRKASSGVGPRSLGRSAGRSVGKGSPHVVSCWPPDHAGSEVLASEVDVSVQALSEVEVSEDQDESDDELSLLLPLSLLPPSLLSLTRTSRSVGPCLAPSSHRPSVSRRFVEMRGPLPGDARPAGGIIGR